MAAQYLTSNLFRDDAALNVCLVDDDAHVVVGAQGEHVARIQLALCVLDRVAVNTSELKASLYGSSTSAAVLAYKRKRNIINYAYQTQADSIVGKMTIAALDQEMLAWESNRSTSPYCGDPITESGASPYSFMRHALTVGLLPVNAPSPAPSPTPPLPPKLLPGNVNMVWQPARSAGSSAGRTLKYLSKAIGLLKSFGLGMMSSIASPPDAPFPFDLEVDPDGDATCWQLRNMAEQVRPGSPDVLRILICPFVQTSTAFGATKSGTFHGQFFKPFILLNSAMFRTDECTLIHEFVHAADLKLTDKDHDPDKSSIFATGNNRSILKPEHAAIISNAFFMRRP